jgi:hypothetical protein
MCIVRILFGLRAVCFAIDHTDDSSLTCKGSVASVHKHYTMGGEFQTLLTLALGEKECGTNECVLCFPERNKSKTDGIGGICW